MLTNRTLSHPASGLQKVKLVLGARSAAILGVQKEGGMSAKTDAMPLATATPLAVPEEKSSSGDANKKHTVKTNT